MCLHRIRILTDSLAQNASTLSTCDESPSVTSPSSPFPRNSPSGQWTIFTGDQLGSLFASHILATFERSTAIGNKPLPKLAMVASIVSSKMIETMAQVEGFKFASCLTGFKYIGNTCLNLVKEGYVVPFGYEEAIGFMFGDEVRDKDGVAATVRKLILSSLLMRIHGWEKPI